MPIHANDEIILTLEKPVTGGRMLARHEGQVVFVAGGIPGERVRARIERLGKQMAFAETLEAVDPSPDRRASQVDWACGGSLYAHIAYPRQITLKSELVSDAFTRIAKITLADRVPVMASQEDGYRMRARLHLHEGRLGFFREGTHDLCDAGSTRQLLPSTMAAFRELEAALKSAGVSGVTACELSENTRADERVVLLELDGSRSAPLHFEPVAGITGVFFGDQQSARLTVGYGSPYVTDRLDMSGSVATLTRHVQSFFQANRYLVSRLASRVLEHIPDGPVTDLYAGVGLFAVGLAARGGRKIVAVEGDRSSARDLDANAAAYAGAIRVEHRSVEGYLGRRVPRPDTLLLDPPRTGISSDAMLGVLRLKPRRLVYVSCDLATLARDVKRMVDTGYSLQHIEAFDLFPNTAHVETLVVLTTKGA